MKSNLKPYLFISMALGVVIVLSLTLGAASISVADLIQVLIKPGSNPLAENIFWYVRLPRTIATLLAGAGLAGAGVIIQAVLANKLASPSVIGVNAGAGLGVTLCCALGYLSGWVIAGTAFLGAFFAVLFVVLLASRMQMSKTTLLLSGVAMNTILNAMASAVTTFFPEVAIMSNDFRVGGFGSVTMSRLLPAGLCIIFAIIILMTLCNELDVMKLGEESAQSLGLSVKKMRLIFLVLAALLAGASVSFAGLLGFVGLIVPHIAQKFVGHESRHLLIFSLLFGAFLVSVADLISRLCFQPFELPTGILLSLLGGPFFVYLLVAKKGSVHHG